ncbi:hypothetical protein FEM48_Zijuj10G0019300 [Ziziphus jujuba var. spinosa]|uniref:DC1 domain-containing protein n=1 Tax=Ziziphus jujuba var. spinosa TaxID=714518 RepID=A0A978UKL8_ZIZJJ|nr:hypothetical protein FEM48_Zijuj10G0019300 [Ziziphus jujuba var. spinosa]
MNKLMKVVHTGEEHDLSFREGSLPFSQTCHKCTQLVSRDYYKCIKDGCDEYHLHKDCVELKDLCQFHHPVHPQHPLVIHSNFPHDNSFKCSFCGETKQSRSFYQCNDNQCEFYLDNTCERDFIGWQELLDKYEIQHVFHDHENHRLSPTTRNHALCYACNAPCKCYLFRCFTCNFNIRHDCLALPFTVNYDDHVHPLTLTTSFKEDEHPTAYYCDICEKRRDPDQGIYLCEECPFIAHFECALSLLEDDNHTLDEEEDIRLTNKKVSVEILDQLNEEIDKLREVMEQLFVKKGDGEQLKQKIEEFEERHADAEDMLKRLKQSVEELNMLNMLRQ